MVDFHKKQAVWWRVGPNRPQWIPKQRLEQAAEIKDIDGDFAVITVLNESRKEECYMVPVNAIRARGYLLMGNFTLNRGNRKLMTN